MHAPQQQAILKSAHDGSAEPAVLAAQWASLAAQVAAKEASLQALSDSLTQAEAALLVAAQQGNADATAGLLAAALGAARPAGGESEEVQAARWRCLAARRVELAARWQCLAEEMRQLGALTVQAQRSAGSDAGFEPGAAPIRDVTCSIITHQVGE